jgi:polysaccharide biosynthesis PFTS motif protein
MIYDCAKNRLKSIISGKKNIIKLNKENEIDTFKKKILNLDFEISENKLRTFSFCKKSNLKKVLLGKLKKIFSSDRNFFFPTLLEEIYISFAKKKYQRKFCLPINSEIIKKIKKESNIEIATGKCFLLWNFFIFFHFFKSIKNFAGILYFNIKNIFDKEIYENSVFFDLSVDYNDLLNNQNNFHVITQYIKKSNIKNIYAKPSSNISRKLFFDKITESKNGYNFFYIESPIPLFKKKNTIFFFSIWFFYSICLVIYDFLKGNWYSILLFEEIVIAKAFSYASKNQIMDEYIFSYQGIGSRPLWTYDAEDKKKKVSLFFYSTNTEPYAINGLHPPKNTSNWAHLSFNHFYVWNQFQKEVILKNIINRKFSIEILGPTLIHVNKNYKLSISNFISVFDITPERFAKKLFLTKDIINGYYISNFFKDILKISIEKKIPLIIRTKKSCFDKYNYDKTYVSLLQNIKKKYHVEIVDRDNSSLDEIIEKSLCCISFPFTSTAIVANELKKPSIYYDPSKSITGLNNHIDHGIRTINDFDTLKNWIENQKSRF